MQPDKETSPRVALSPFPTTTDRVQIHHDANATPTTKSTRLLSNTVAPAALAIGAAVVAAGLTVGAAELEEDANVVLEAAAVVSVGDGEDVLSLDDVAAAELEEVSVCEEDAAAVEVDAAAV